MSATKGAQNRRPSAQVLLMTDHALLLRGDLRDLGMERRAVDAAFKILPNVVIPGYSRRMVKSEDVRALLNPVPTTEETS